MISAMAEHAGTQFIESCGFTNVTIDERHGASTTVLAFKRMPRGDKMVNVEHVFNVKENGVFWVR